MKILEKMDEKMGMFRNPEIKEWIIAYIVFVLAAVFGASFFNAYVVAYVLVICIVFALLFWVFTLKRYRAISNLTYRLNEILHGIEHIHFVPDKEGELALLSSEIYKMIRCLKEQAEELQKEKMYLSDSLADISHQIRTPLTSVRMILPRIGREDLSTAERIGSILEISNLLNRIEGQMDALLKIARLESGTVIFKKENVDAAMVLEKALEPLEIMIEIKGLILDREVRPDTTYLGDFFWSVEALGNILKNCVEHLPENGRLKVKAHKNPLYTEIIILDNGPGIAPEDIPHLFERFYKGKDAKIENAGIGLSLSKMIIKEQNGEIEVRNREPQGALFQIRFYQKEE